MYPEYSNRNMPTFLSLETRATSTTAALAPTPPTPPSRTSLVTKHKLAKKISKGSPVRSSSSSRHEKCFKSPESPILKVKKSVSVVGKKSNVSIARSKSAGTVSSALTKQSRSNEPKHYASQQYSIYQLRNPVRETAYRQSSRSPVAFGRSISKERTFAEEKKRIENALPALNRHTFEASTNILRDPLLKSPQDVKKAVRSLAACAAHRSRSMPRFCSGCRTHAGPTFVSYYPEIEHYGVTEWTRYSSNKKSDDKKSAEVKKSASLKQIYKSNSNISLAESNSTYSVDYAPATIKYDGNKIKSQTAQPAAKEAKICKKLKSNLKTASETVPQSVRHFEGISQRKASENNLVGKLEKIECKVQSKNELPPRPNQKPDQQLSWHDFKPKTYKSLPHYESEKAVTSSTAGGHKSRSLSPLRAKLYSKDFYNTFSKRNTKQTEKPPSPTREIRVPVVPALPAAPASRAAEYAEVAPATQNITRKFSPTREVRVPQTTTTNTSYSRNVRSPSRRKIDSCRSSANTKLVRTSSLSSAEDRSKQGFYLCSELAHSATSLASNDPHARACRYRNHSERFSELNDFYSTLERVGQLERATSQTKFKPIRKESELLDYEEWRQLRLHERAEKELNYLVGKLKQEQQEKDLLFLSKDINDVKWRKETDIGLNSREKSVEDLRDNFEKYNFLQEYSQHGNNPGCYMKYWRRNTVADLTHSLEQKFQDSGNPAMNPETHFSEQLVNSLPHEQMKKISRQINEIYTEPAAADSASQQQEAEDKFVVTVDRQTVPSSGLKVRSKSSISRDELLESVMKKKCSDPNYATLPKRNALDKEQTPEIPPPPPPLPEIKQTEIVHQATAEEKDDQNLGKDTVDIMRKIKYFEERKYDKQPKTIYHAREDSSPDEDEVMRIIEERMRADQYRAYAQRNHKELSSSLTDLCEIFGQKNSSRTNFHSVSPQQKPPDEQQDDYTDIRYSFCSPHSSMDFFDHYSRSRSASPQSQCSSYLQRVKTGDVQKIKDKFESLGYDDMRRNHFFEQSSLRKVRSDPELNTMSGSESKDIFENGDVAWITHKFEIRNKMQHADDCHARGRNRMKKPRLLLSPTPLRDRLMPHIDRISKTASLGNMKCGRSHNSSPTRSVSSNSGIVERLRLRYDTNRLSLSSPDVREIHEFIPQHLNASWVAHRYPSPTQNAVAMESAVLLRAAEAAPSKKPLKTKTKTPKKKETKRTSSAIKSALSRTMTTTTRTTSSTTDIFANQEFNAKIHQPKYRYVPDGAESKRAVRENNKKSANAVKFEGSPNQYYESDVNIHFKTPVRQEVKYSIPEEELAFRQAEQMQKLYQEERRRKYLQELQDMNSRRHTDNFTPSQKSPIALNRYDDFPADLAPKNIGINLKMVARAMFNFQGQNSRELSFKKGDIIYIKRCIDKNWYEGEHNAMIGLFPANYVEIISKDNSNVTSHAPLPRKPSEGQARAKYSFQAQSGVELSLNKGELVALTRRVDDNWFEGRIANRKGIFPVSYVEILTDIGAEDIAAKTTVTQRVTATTVNTMPSMDSLRTKINNEINTITRNGAQPPMTILKSTHSNPLKTDILHVDTSSEPLVYRALYKYRPQNTDELELLEGDLVHVLEKCDDGWFVGTSQRTGCFGTFPGNYVERL